MTRTSYKTEQRNLRIATRNTRARANRVPSMIRWAGQMTFLKTVLGTLTPTIRARENAELYLNAKFES